MFSRVFPRGERSLLLWLLISFVYIVYLASRTEKDQIPQHVAQYFLADTESNRKSNKFFVDMDGNKIQMFDEKTLFPKPGGGYCNMTPANDKEDYFRALTIPSAQCKDLQQFGLYQVCLDGFENKDNCVVLSFGISYDFTFEDLIVDRLGCQAYSFDPTMDTENHVRKDGKDQFFKIGLSSFKGVKTMDYHKRRNRTCKVDRYVNIIHMLGIMNKDIDFIKIDIEGSELDVFLDTASNHPELLQNIKQFQLEFHNLEKCCFWHSGNRKDTTQIDMMKIVQILHCHGFAMVHTRWNPSKYLHIWYGGKERSLCYVTTWIRT